MTLVLFVRIQFFTLKILTRYSTLFNKKKSFSKTVYVKIKKSLITHSIGRLESETKNRRKKISCNFSILLISANGNFVCFGSVSHHNPLSAGAHLAIFRREYARNNLLSSIY